MYTTNHTHVKVGHISQFPFAIHWWTLKNPKNQTFEKMKKIAGDIIILYMCTKNHNYMRHRMRYRMKHNFFSFLSFFCPVTPLPLTTQKTKILKKWKKHLPDVIILNLCNKKHDHMYAYSNMECDRHNCHSRSFFALLPHYWLQKLKLKFGKNIRKLDILSFNTCVP